MSRSGGRPLDPPVREVLELFFRCDLGAVRLHAGGGARAVARGLGAAAVTFGERVLFSAGAWPAVARREPRGVALVAHEVVHVLQYRRLGWWRMLLSYVGGYLAGRVQGRTHAASYRRLPAEREAFARGRALAELLAGQPALAAAVLRGGALTAAQRVAVARAGDAAPGGADGTGAGRILRT